jgi:hypothetical protein
MLTAVIVGVWTALYLGVRAGVIAAVAVAAAMLASSIIPGVSITVYVLVIAWCAALFFVFPRLMKSGGVPGAPGAQKGFKPSGLTASSVLSQAASAWSWARKKLQR